MRARACAGSGRTWGGQLPCEKVWAAVSRRNDREPGTVRGRADGLYWACDFRSVEHGLSHARWSRRFTLLGVVAAVSTAAAGAGFLTSAKAGTWLAIASGVLALFAAALTAATTALQPKAKAEEHKQAADAYATLRSELRDFLDLTLEQAPEAAYDRYMEFAKRRRDVQAAAPAVEEWARKQVIRRGGTERSKTAGYSAPPSPLG